MVFELVCMCYEVVCYGGVMENVYIGIVNIRLILVFLSMLWIFV